MHCKICSKIAFGTRRKAKQHGQRIADELQTRFSVYRCPVDPSKWHLSTKVGFNGRMRKYKSYKTLNMFLP